jgi:hypothetical protein
MGAANSNLTRCIEDEHHRLVKHDRDYLVIDEILSLRLPPSSWSVDTSHLGVIFMLDRQALPSASLLKCATPHCCMRAVPSSAQRTAPC